MRWTRKTIAIAVTGAAFLLGGGAAAAGALTSNSSPSVILAAPAARATAVTPAPTKTVTAPPSPVPTKTVTAPPAPVQTPAWQQPSSAPVAQPQFTNGSAVVAQYYQDITDHNYSAAWALGGSNLSGGVGYSSWVAGYATTASISLGTFSYFGSDQVQVIITALQTDGSTNTYQGTYTVENGQITSANITQTGGAAPAAAPAIPSGTYAGYVADIHAAGITAPDTWIVQTGEALVRDWRNGQTTAQTDQILLAGGILPGHLAAFDSITQQDLGA